MSGSFVAARWVKHLDPPPSVCARSGHTQTTVGKRVFFLAGIGGANGADPVRTVDILDLIRWGESGIINTCVCHTLTACDGKLCRVKSRAQGRARAATILLKFLDTATLLASSKAARKSLFSEA
jgi:hypothetical protein